MTVARVRRQTLDVLVSGPGRTEAIDQQLVRAPFDGVLTSLRVQDGDRVWPGEVLATEVSTNSQAALRGAQALLAAARTPEEKRSARRAMQLAKRSLVAVSLRAPKNSVVVSHQVNSGAVVAKDETLVTLAATDSFVFIAQIAQSDLPDVHPGLPARIVLVSRPQGIPARVHALLPTSSGNDLTALVRLDFQPRRAPPAVGLFGTAQIIVGAHPNAEVVPPQAILRNDITGVTRIALISKDHHLRWTDVTTGIETPSAVEIVKPVLPSGAFVAVDGQVGLSDGAPVAPTLQGSNGTAPSDLADGPKAPGRTR